MKAMWTDLYRQTVQELGLDDRWPGDQMPEAWPRLMMEMDRLISIREGPDSTTITPSEKAKEVLKLTLTMFAGGTFKNAVLDRYPHGGFMLYFVKDGWMMMEIIFNDGSSLRKGLWSLTGKTGREAMLSMEYKPVSKTEDGQ